MSAPTSRILHPCVSTLTDGNRGAEFSTWAHLILPQKEETITDNINNKSVSANLVTACGSSIHIYSVIHEENDNNDNAGETEQEHNRMDTKYKLCLEHSFGHLAGTVISIHTLPSGTDHIPDAILVVFADTPRLVVVTLTDNSTISNNSSSNNNHQYHHQYQHNNTYLRAETLLDFSTAQQEAGMGAMEYANAQVVVSHDTKHSSHTTTVACILGKGVAVALFTVRVQANGIWYCDKEPFLIPLSKLYTSICKNNTSNTNIENSHPIHDTTSSHLNHSTGFGDILDATFLPGYLEAVVVLLHTSTSGETWTGRLGRGAAFHQMTAVSVAPHHQRAAVLWNCRVPSDTFQVSVTTITTSTTTTNAQQQSSVLVVLGVNTITFVNGNSGHVQQCMAVNGWAPSSCSSSSTFVSSPTSQLQLQPNPGLKLAIALDGAVLEWCTHCVGILSLRHGQLYLLQLLPTQEWTLLPLGQTVTGMGQVASLAAKIPNHIENSHRGLIFVGSRLGNSVLMEIALQHVTLEPSSPLLSAILMFDGNDSTDTNDNNTNDILLNDSVYQMNEMLRIEDEALYAPPVQEIDCEQVQKKQHSQHADIVPPSDEEGEDKTIPSSTTSSKRARRMMQQLWTVQALTAHDVLVHTGPLGPSCMGPLSGVPHFLKEQNSEIDDFIASTEKNPIFSATAHIVPAGYGSSGGLALITVPGRDDRVIVAEADCRNACGVFSVANRVWLAMPDGIRILESRNNSDLVVLEQIDTHNWCTGASIPEGPFLDALEIFESLLLYAGECADGCIALIVRSVATLEVALVLATVHDNVESGNGTSSIDIIQQISLHSDNASIGVIVNITPIVKFSQKTSVIASFGCLWSEGAASVVTVYANRSTSTLWFTKNKSDNATPMDMEDESLTEEEQEEKKLKDFYNDDSVIAIDIFRAPIVAFQNPIIDTKEISGVYLKEQSVSKPTPSVNIDPEHLEPTNYSILTVVNLKMELKKRGLSTTGNKANLVATLEESDCQNTVMTDVVINPNIESASILNAHTANQSLVEKEFAFDEDDQELYASEKRITQTKSTSTEGTRGTFHLDCNKESSFAAICRKSGDMELYLISDDGTERNLCWKAKGGALGVSKLINADLNPEEIRRPRSHIVSAKEIRFFWCGSSKCHKNKRDTYRKLCFGLETTAGDFFLYRLHFGNGRFLPFFERLPLHSIARQSQEQGRHRGKLLRKGIVERKKIDEVTPFVYNALYPFTDITGQDGMFVSGPRPLWIVSERGRPTTLMHRTRHAAPAGGKPRPVTGFCHKVCANDCFLTLHERVGRVGTQRLTMFKDISPALKSQGLLPGGGLCVEKVPLGVTVRNIVLIDDESIMTGDHPLYALLVSREVQLDQRTINTDGLTSEERRLMELEKERAKTARQVEADLGGFEVENEWVEEIEREDCFKIDTELGGAPPIHQSIFSLWIVDAADRWMVVDSIELGEYERALDLKCMHLTEFLDDPAAANSSTAEEVGTKRFFLVVGTGTVNHNGEDVATKGRVLLFEVKQPNPTSMAASSPLVELSLAFEKNIFHGPVTSLSCLVADGRNRLVVGAGSDVNIEQWGSNGKLTQVGFFRATMHVLDILHFKNFLLLSDAYDSLYFLVWRESDKSLTLLAKDYDPIPVYAAGVMSRGASMTFLCHDDRQNLQFFQYAPGEAAARGGNKLVCRADFHLGYLTTSFQTYFCRPSLLIHTATPGSTLTALKQQDSLFGRQDDDQRLGVHFGTSDGELGTVIPLSEPVYWRLIALQSVLANALESDCALSCRAWRLYRRTPRRGGCRSNERKKGVIDGDLVVKYAELPITDQEDIASAIGSTVALIMDNLLELQCASMIL